MFQGQTVAKPNNLVVDVTSSHQPGMVYVMLSRVCSMEQLHILDKFEEGKILLNADVRSEANRMTAVSLNSNPCDWMNPSKVGLRVCSLNCRSLRKHIGDVKTDPVLLQADVICLQETWLEKEEGETGDYQLEGYQAFFASVGPGKGLAVYMNERLRRPESHFTDANIQLTKISANEMEIVNVYRSQEEPLPTAAFHLRNLLDPQRDTLVIGDLNICATKPNPLRNFLEGAGFQQLVTLPTHVKGGSQVIELCCTCYDCFLLGILDHAHLRRRGQSQRMGRPVIVKTFTPYYSDHDIVTCFFPEGK